jgi:hypothetical protein
MSYQEAQQILDARRNGADMCQSLVNQALELTGDIEYRFSFADAVLGVPQ